MSIWKRLKRLLLSKPLPQDAQKAVRNANSLETLILGLERSATRNEMELKRLQNELAELEKMEQKEVAKIREGVAGERLERVILRRIKRLRMRMDSVEKQMDTLERNQMALTHLLTKVRQMRAMAKMGVTEEQVEEVLDAYEAQEEEWQEVLEQIEGLSATEQQPSDEQELEELRKEILSKKAEKKAKEEVEERLEKQAEADAEG